MRASLFAAIVLLVAFPAAADVGDPQIKTDHPWYPGELACSTFERLFETQAVLYERVVGTRPETDEQKALASWFWRNTHYAHAEEGAENLWGKGFTKGGADLRTRDYWTGLFAHGFGLCGTTHSQWTAEMNELLGHVRSRGVGVTGHNSFEVFLKGGPYGKGTWVLLDHDISTVIFSEDGKRLLSIREVKANLRKLGDPNYKTGKQHGWRVAGLHPKDAFGVYDTFRVAEYLAGYPGGRPIVRLRRGETLRRHLRSGLDDGKTFVFWGRNYNADGIPGPERSQTWVNQPEKMYKATRSTPYKRGQARFANAVYTYAPKFRSGDYKEGVVKENDSSVTFEFSTPYIIGATPPNNSNWGVYQPGGKNGLVLKGRASCPVAVSVDRGRTWKEAGNFRDGLDLTDHVKGFRQYFIRFGAGARALAGSGLTMRTVCQANVSIIPRLKDGGTKVSFESSGRGVVSVGPTLQQAETHVVQGAFGSRNVTLEVATPRKEPIRAIHAIAHVASSSPPRPEFKYQIEYSFDGGSSWKSLVKDWQITRQGDEPGDFWSQSFCYGSLDVPKGEESSVQVRFRNDGGKRYRRAEIHLEYETQRKDSTKVTFNWTDDKGDHEESHLFRHGKPAPWNLKTGRNVRTRWVEFAPVAR